MMTRNDCERRQYRRATLGTGWFKRFRFSPSKTLAFLTQIRVSVLVICLQAFDHSEPEFTNYVLSLSSLLECGNRQ
jgi:hypothetical protein